MLRCETVASEALPSWGSSVLFLLLKEPPKMFFFFFSAWPPGTVISLSCSLLRNTVPLMKQRAISHPMAKLRSSGVLISPAQRCGAWLHPPSQVKLREVIQSPGALLSCHESHINMKMPFPFTFYRLSRNTVRFRDLVQYRISYTYTFCQILKKLGCMAKPSWTMEFLQSSWCWGHSGLPGTQQIMSGRYGPLAFMSSQPYVSSLNICCFRCLLQ